MSFQSHMMVSFHSNPLHLIFLFILYNFYPYTKAQADNTNTPLSNLFKSNCNSAINYTHGTSFEKNLNLTLSTLVSNVSLNGFSNFTSGQNPDTVYGLIQCKGDVSDQFCAICAQNAATQIKQICPNQKEATLVKINCTIQYSYMPLSSVADSSEIMFLFNYQNASNQSDFDTKLGSLMKSLASSAASSSYKLAAGRTDYNDFQEIYAMAQCLRGSTESSCLSCLQQIISSVPSSCCGGSSPVGEQIISTGCNLRYETYSFFVSPLASFPQTAPAPSPHQAPDHNLASNGTTNSTASGSKSTVKKIVIVVISVAVASIVIFTISGCLICKKSKKDRTYDNHMEDETSSDSLFINLSTLKLATRNFSETNKLGQGGFGPVYKERWSEFHQISKEGKLPDGKKVAVKRLSSTSGQGLAELRTEVMLVAKLLHQNLVSLLGFCLDDEEKLLVYEYLPNGSLDKILFDETKKYQLKWEMRYKIIVGIARGLIYLHEDSQLRVVHRDLKPSNILLEEDMNPKISDFGLARLFCGSQTQDNTNRIAGTYGYMAPEYIKSGNFSIKSDVFSFGILVLEILTGHKNSYFRNSTNIQSYAWQQWSNGTALDMVDSSLGNQWPRDEVLKCIHIGLLCAQDSASNRPTMSEIVTMLDSYTLVSPAATKPAFFVPMKGLPYLTTMKNNNESASSQHGDQSMSGSSLPQQSVNEVTISGLDPR